MRAASLQQDYWPGYLDALVNVMLYLLLLVGSFALGMVALTLHSMQQQQQLSFLGERTEKLVEQMDLTDGEKAQMSERLASLNIEAMVQRRAELDRERQLEAVRLEQQRLQAEQQAVPVRRAVSPAAPSVELNAAQQVAQAAQKAELSKQLSFADREYTELVALLEKEKKQLEQMRQSVPVKPVELVTDLRVSNRGPGSAVTSGSSGSEALFTSPPKSTWIFDTTQFIWSAGKAMPSELTDADRANAWKLVIHADTTNSRITRESFARVNSVREVLVQQGFIRERIKVEVRSIEGIAVKDERLFRTVYMLQDN
jgi:hypothetical protein